MRPQLYRSSLGALGYGFSHGRGSLLVAGRLAGVDLRTVPTGVRWTGLRRWTPGTRAPIPTAFAVLAGPAIEPPTIEPPNPTSPRPSTFVPGWYGTTTIAVPEAGATIPGATIQDATAPTATFPRATAPSADPRSRALAALQARLRLSYLSSAEQRSRAERGRGLTTVELQDALAQFPH